MAGYKMGAGKAPGKKAYDGFSGFQQRGLISPLQQEKKTVLSHPGEKPILGRFTEGSKEAARNEKQRRWVLYATR